MASSAKDIKHKGIVVGISQDMVEVMIKAESACTACKAKSVCGMDESEQMVIAIETPCAEAYSLDEEVAVSIKQIMGLKAVLYVYMLPFLIVLLSLIGLLQIGVSELTAGLGALGVLVIYYFLLYLFRSKVEKEINFGIEKI